MQERTPNASIGWLLVARPARVRESEAAALDQTQTKPLKDTTSAREKGDAESVRPGQAIMLYQQQAAANARFCV
jgi:hypothetical protein